MHPAEPPSSPSEAGPAHEWLGCVPFPDMWRRMRTRATEIAGGRATEIVWACEHEAVYTTGRRGVDNRLRLLPADLISCDRGGETTFHGPGQLLLYPVLYLRRRGLGVRAYVHLLEQSCIDLLRAYGVDAGRRRGCPGVWIGDAKIAAVGIRVRNGVAYHGMALNVAVEQRWFAAIRPCGLALPVVNLAEIASAPPIPVLARTWIGHLRQRLACIYTQEASRYGSPP